jgi:hypothetical protein
MMMVFREDLWWFLWWWCWFLLWLVVVFGGSYVFFVGFLHWECWSGGPIHKKIRKGLRSIWEVVIWVIQRAINGCIFNSEITMWDELVEEVKVMS